MPDSRIYEDGITEAEDTYIKKVWDGLDGSSCYNSALTLIAQGKG